MRRSHGGFSLIELVFVIVLLGIVASVGSQIISRLYISQLLQQTSYSLNRDSDILINQLANRLQYAIKETIIKKLDAKTDNITMLQWVSSDFDGFNAISSNSLKPGWSGKIDTNKSTSHELFSLASDFALEERIISNLSTRQLDMVLYFKGERQGYRVESYEKRKSIFYLDKAFGIPNDHYELAWHSYALVLTDGILYLYYDMPAFAGAKLSAERSILAKDVSVLAFSWTSKGGTIQICQKRKIDSDDEIEVCKKRYIS